MDAKWGCPGASTGDAASRNEFGGVSPSRALPEDGTKSHHECARRPRPVTHQSKKILLVVHIIPNSQHTGRPLRFFRQIASERRKQRGRLPRECFKTGPVELLPTQPDEICSLPIRGRPEHRSPPAESRSHSGPVDFVHVRTVAPDGNHVFVPFSEGISKSVCQPLAKALSPLSSTRHLENGKSTLVNRPPGMTEEDLGHLSMCGVVLPHELFVLPLALGAMAKEQNGGMVAGGVDTRRFEAEETKQKWPSESAVEGTSGSPLQDSANV